MKNLYYLNKYFVKYKWHLLLGILFVTLSNYFRLKVPKSIRKALDYILDNSLCYKEYKGTDYGSSQLDEIGNAIFEYGLYVLGFSIIMGIFMYFMRQTIIVMSRLIEYDLRKEIFEQYENLDLAFFKRNKTGDLMSRITEDVTKVRMYLGPALLYGINLTALFIFVIYSMFEVDIKLSLYTLIPLPILSISIYLVSDIIHKRSEIIQKQLAKLNSTAQEVFSGIRVVKSYVKEKQFGHFFLTESNDFKSKSMDLAKVDALFFPLMVLLVSCSTLTTVVIGGFQVYQGNITPGNIAEFVIYVNMLTWPVTSIGWIASIIQQAEASQERVNEFLHQKPQILNHNSETTELKGQISFKNLSFVYPDTGIKALDSINFEIAPGAKLAILGKTASGKSTIADLLLRMYDPTEGHIEIDGIDIRDMNLENIRQRIGYVPQDVFLFSDSIYNNVRFGNSCASDETVEKYTRYAAIYDDIIKLPHQFNTEVGERGVSLSGGQKQRISIARAFLKNPDIVILDDCLSAVDTNTEQQILDYLKEFLVDKTAIMITHRIYNLLDFDKIIVLDRGKIIEAGTHDELIQLKGAYYSQLEHQQHEKKGGA